MVFQLLLQKAIFSDYKDTRIEPNQDAWATAKPDFDRDALGAVPVLKLNDQIFYQTEAIIEWASAKAGIQSDDPIERMQVKMIEETIKEVVLKAFQDSGLSLNFEATFKFMNC